MKRHTQTDLAYAMYYASGKVFTCNKSDWENGRTEQIQEIDFVPTEECPALNEQIESDIKSYYYHKMRLEEITTLEEFTKDMTFQFVGSYNGAFVITKLESMYWGYPADVPSPVYIGGFVWEGAYANDLYVFRYEVHWEEMQSETFYSLQEAYAYGGLTQEDLQSIAYYHDNAIAYPDNLSEDTAKAMKKAWAQTIRDDDSDSDITEESVVVRSYYGTYQDCVAVIVERIGTLYPAIYAPITIDIGGVSFHYNNPGPQIVVWKM